MKEFLKRMDRLERNPIPKQPMNENFVWVTNCSDDDAWDWMRKGFQIGEPAPSEVYNVEQMKEQGMTGVYRYEPPTIPALFPLLPEYISPRPLQQQWSNWIMLIPEKENLEKYADIMNLVLDRRSTKGEDDGGK